MTKPKIIFHVGYPKAGSKSLQTFIHSNLDLLADQGFYYPRYVEGQWFGNGLPLIRLIKDTDNEQQFKNYFLKDIESAGNAVILYSHESLYNQLKENHLWLLSEIFDEVSFFFYLRRQDLWLESYYKWMIGMGLPINLDQEMKKLPLFHLGNYRKKLLHFQKFTGKANMIVRPFEVQQFYQNDLCKDFLHAIDVKDRYFGRFIYPDRRLNVSLEGYVLAYKRRINKYLESETLMSHGKKFDNDWKGAKLTHILRDYMAEKGVKKQDLLNPSVKKEIIEHYSKINEWVVKQYIDPQENVLFKAPLPKTDPGFNEPEVSLSQVREINTFVFNRLVNEQSDQIAPILSTFARDFLLNQDINSLT